MKFFKFFLFIIASIVIVSCSSDDETTDSPSTNVLTVTSAVPVVTATQVTLGGEVTKDGGKPVTERGICIGETINPIVNDPDGFTGSIGAGLGVFTNNYSIDPSTPANTTFHYRAFAKNADGTAYGEDKTFTTLASPACNVIQVNTAAGQTTTISTPTTWTAGNVYFLKGYVVVTSVLTIQPGVIIKLEGGQISPQGTTGKVIAIGTANNRIVFTSGADDSYCGDSNGDGTLTQPLKGDWYSIKLNTAGNNEFTYCDFLYAGKDSGGTNRCIDLAATTNQFNFDHCTFAHTKTGNSNGAVIFGGEYMNDASVSQFTNNAIYDCDRPMWISHGYTVNTNNIFHNPTNPSQTNLRNGIFMRSYGFGLNAVTWGVSEVPYVVEDYLQYCCSKTVNVGPNVMIKFSSTSHGITYQFNTFNLNSSAILTSYKDDTVGGDTNGDGNSSAPATGDWYGLYKNYAPSGFVINGNIRYAAN